MSRRWWVLSVVLVGAVMNLGLGTVFFTSGAIAGVLSVAASCALCAVLVPALPTTERKAP